MVPSVREFHQTRIWIGSHADCAQIVDAVERAAADPGVAAIVLTGAGSAFCAGGDLDAMRERRGIGPLDSPLATRNNYQAGVQRIPLALWQCEVPTIAAINGAAIGVGLDLALMCDVRIAAAGAKLAASFIKVGIVPGDGGAWFLPRAVGWSKAAEMMFTGDPVSAEEGLACGLVSRVVPGEQVLAAGICCGYPAGSRDAHHFINRSAAPARYLEIGTRVKGDMSLYPDDDLMWRDDGDGKYAAHKDGRKYPG